MNVGKAQPSILAPVPPLGRALTFSLKPGADSSSSLRTLRDTFSLDWGVVGIGEPVTRAFGRTIAGLRAFPTLSGQGVKVPSTQQALWVFLRGDDRGVLFDLSERARALVEGAFELQDVLDTFMYAGGRDLTGYVDGTENPKGEAAVDAAIVSNGDRMVGSSFVAVQRWVHDLSRFRGFTPEGRDAVMGRQLKTNEEIGDAPPSAHVKRSAQESFDPTAFMLRRSMPWAAALEQGLEFIAYGESLDRYEWVLKRMIGTEDGIVDGLFTFSRPVTGSYYWCPPVDEGRLDFRRLGL